MGGRALTTSIQHQSPYQHPDQPPGSLATDAMRAEILAEVLQALIMQLSARPADDSQSAANSTSMLNVSQAAALLGISRMTVTRKADTGELPCVVVSRGTHQKLRRFPRAMIEYLATHGGAPETDLKDHTARWLASLADRTSAH